MSVNVRIKQKSLFKKKVDIEDILQLIHLPYGVCDENYRLIRNEIGNHTLIYDEKRLARGIDLSLEGSDIVLLLSLPTSLSEIKKYYEIIEMICKELHTKKFIREEEWVCIDDKELFIQADVKASITGLENLHEKLGTDEYKRFEIFGVFYPISIGSKEVNQFGNSLDKFEEYLHHIQSQDVYYACPRVYKVQDKFIGIYAIGSNVVSVVPTKPYIILNQIQGIEEWYVMLRQGKTIQYIDFINHIQHKEYFDMNHVVTILNEDEIDDLLNNYSVEIK